MLVAAGTQLLQLLSGSLLLNPISDTLYYLFRNQRNEADTSLQCTQSGSHFGSHPVDINN